ncbi:MAG: hypothetical protein Kow00127_23610 [Bacteroidales bacterium]
MEQDRSTEEKIMEAARKVFHRKGLAGSRMQEIADEAGINKALLHYYFRSKDRLFDAVFIEAFNKLLASVRGVLDADMPLFDKIRDFVRVYQENIDQNSFIPAFVINEVNQNPEKILVQFVKSVNLPGKFIEQVGEAIRNHQIRPVSPKDLLVNMMSMSLFPYVAAPIIRTILFRNDQTEYQRFLLQRRETVSEFIINAIKP